MKLSNKKFLVQFIFFFIFIDRIIFDTILWKLPNESPWGTNHFFNFVYEFKKIKRENDSLPKILIIGSSVAYYSIDRDLLRESFIKNTGKNYKIEYLSYAGMTPLDAYLVFDEIKNLNPEIIVFPLNFIDYRLHRAYILDSNNRNDSVSDEIMIRDALDFGQAPQSKYAFPMQSLYEFYSILDKEQNSVYLMSYLFPFYRYRDIYFANLKNIYNHRYGKNISYHGYAGVQISERVNSLGWTGKKFSFFPKEYMFSKGFYIQVVPEILKNGQLELRLTDEKNNEQIYYFKKSGWQNVQLKKEFINFESIIHAELSATWIPKEASGDLFDHSEDMLGVRLQQNFGLDFPLNNMQYVREERIEDLRYVNMSDEKYRKYFEYRLLSDLEHRPGIAYLHALKDAKIRLTRENFYPTIHFQYLKKICENIEKSNLKILFINNPENPISMEWYSASSWYKDHLIFLNSLNSNNCKFVDMKNELKMQDFSDFHHVTYPGMVKMNPIYFAEINKLIKKVNNN